jgi:hypothetical protein
VQQQRARCGSAPRPPGCACPRPPPHPSQPAGPRGLAPSPARVQGPGRDEVPKGVHVGHPQDARAGEGGAQALLHACGCSRPQPLATSAAAARLAARPLSAPAAAQAMRCDAPCRGSAGWLAGCPPRLRKGLTRYLGSGKAGEERRGAGAAAAAPGSSAMTHAALRKGVGGWVGQLAPGQHACSRPAAARALQAAGTRRRLCPAAAAGPRAPRTCPRPPPSACR